MAGFQLTLHGRIWVTPEASEANVIGRFGTRLPEMLHVPQSRPHFGLCEIKIVSAYPLRKEFKRTSSALTNRS
jgi:hypothetical protein